MRRVRVEDFLMAIRRLCDETGSELAKSGQIAKAVGVSAGNASITLARLAIDGWIIYYPYEGSKLTKLGRIRTSKIIRRVEIIALFLERFLNWELETIAEEARCLEPAVSDRVLKALDSLLGFPKVSRSAELILPADCTRPYVDTSITCVGHSICEHSQTE